MFCGTTNLIADLTNVKGFVSVCKLYKRAREMCHTVYVALPKTGHLHNFARLRSQIGKCGLRYNATNRETIQKLGS